MEGSRHRFVRLLRLFGVRVSVAEAADAMLAAAQPGMLADRQTLRAALRVTLIKDRRDDELFDELFTAFFSLRPIAGPAGEHGHSHAHDDLADTGELESFTVSEEPSELPQQGHSHGKLADTRDYFRQEDLAQQYNLHQEANKIDLASVTDEIVLSKEGVDSARDAGAWVQLETDRLHNPRPAGPARSGNRAPGRHRTDGGPAGGASRLARDSRRGSGRAGPGDAAAAAGGHHATCPSCCDATWTRSAALWWRPESPKAGGPRPSTSRSGPTGGGAAPTGPPAPGRPDQQAAQHTARPRQPGPDYAQEHAL